MSAELKPNTPNTPITPENVGLLKAGDWLLHPEWGLAQYQPLSEDDNSLTGPWTYIGPDLGDGWIGWGGGENPVPGMMVETRFRDGSWSLQAFASEGFVWTRDGRLKPSIDITAFRPALAKPAEGEVKCVDCNGTGSVRLKTQCGVLNVDCNTCCGIDRATPTPPSVDHIGDATEKVDWSVVGPKLVEALESIKAGGSWQGDTASDALAAAQPEGK